MREVRLQVCARRWRCLRGRVGIRYCSWVGAQDVFRSLGIQVSNPIHLTGLRLHRFACEAFIETYRNYRNSTRSRYQWMTRLLHDSHDSIDLRPIVPWATEQPSVSAAPRKGTYHHSDGLRTEGKDLLICCWATVSF